MRGIIHAGDFVQLSVVYLAGDFVQLSFAYIVRGIIHAGDLVSPCSGFADN